MKIMKALKHMKGGREGKALLHALHYLHDLHGQKRLICGQLDRGGVALPVLAAPYTRSASRA